MKKQVWLLLILVFFNHLSSLEIRGYVANDQGEPLADVFIIGADGLALTDRTGAYRLAGPVADSLILFHKIGYRDRTFSVADLPDTVWLTIDPLILPGVIVRDNSTSNDLFVKKLTMKNFTGHRQDLIRLLRANSVLQLTGSALPGEEQKILLPGLSADYTMVMLDGIPLGRPGEGFDISLIPADLIDQVEMIPGSERSGGGGMVINLLTRKNRHNLGATLSLTAGSYSLFQQNLSLAGKRNNWSFDLYLNNLSASNNFLYKLPWNNPDSLRQRINNDKRGQDAGAGFCWRNSGWYLSYRFLYQDVFRKLPGPVNNPELFWNSRLTAINRRHHLLLEKLTPAGLGQLRIFRTEDRAIYDNTRISEPWSNFSYYYIRNRTDFESYGLLLSMKGRLAGWDYRLEGDFQKQSFSYLEYTAPENNIETARRWLGAVNPGVSRQWKVAAWLALLDLSCRQEWLSEQKSLSAWRLAPGLEIGESWKLRLGVALHRSNTLPSFYELYWQGDTQAMGNPDLQPEELLTWQTQLEFDFRKQTLKLSYRHDDIDHKIIWINDFNYAWKPVNIGAASIKTWRIEASLQPIHFFWMTSTLALVQSRDLTRTSSEEPSAYYGKDLIYTPDSHLDLNWYLQAGSLLLLVNYERTGKQWTTRDQLTAEKQLPSFDLWNSSISYSVKWATLELKFSADFNNIFNHFYEIYAYSPQPGFNWKAGLELIHNW
ncbi:MAG: TonB-dependent receptor [Candidatus Cloacimonetes bacterium]|nr:TonB-dependent receptor [Candidatus Cloacimonadota bacterium]